MARSISQSSGVILEQLKRDGHDTTSAEQLLATFEESQRLHVEHRDRLKRELSDADRT